MSSGWINRKPVNYSSNTCTITSLHYQRASIAQGQFGYIKCSISKLVMSQYDAKIRHMKRNLYKRPKLHRGMYLRLIYVLQKSSVRKVSQVGNRNHTQPLFKQHQMLNIYQLYKCL